MILFFSGMIPDANYIHVVKLYTLHIVYRRKTENDIVTRMFVS
jgi:hypothetical protein